MREEFVLNESFYFSAVTTTESNSFVLKMLENYAKESLKQIYIIQQPLSETKYKYEFERAFLIMIPKHKLIFVNFAEKDNNDFEVYVEDFIEDLGHISNKYDYTQIIGRPRNWREHFFAEIHCTDFQSQEIGSFLSGYLLNNKTEERKGEFLISLLTGSINDVNRVGDSLPDNLLEKVKRKIVLFDGDQTRFIYQEPQKRRLTVQGLAGTGKTELLLHKLKDLYVKNPDAKIVFTCHNRILAENMKSRITGFFDFVKVDEQIKWEERLWAMRGWGSQSDKNSGLYSYICNFYNLPFKRYSYHISFDEICKEALSLLDKRRDFSPCFTYLLIDESQDFPESFFDLCEKVSEKGIYVAGDIFQNVFEDVAVSSVNPDFLLNKCYRTDPRTLMFAHAVGMGLLEEQALRWLSDEEWEACGYEINKSEGIYKLSRYPLRRFEDLEEEGVTSIELITAEQGAYANKIMMILEDIYQNNSTVTPEDIGIVFLENSKTNYELAAKLQILIANKFGWSVNIGYETKTRVEGSVFISNRNNVKGLEFPFVIVISHGTLDDDLQKRNSIYMMLTRSFIKTYFLISDKNKQIVNELHKGIEGINETGFLVVKEPLEEEKERLRNAIINKPKYSRKSYHDFVEDIMDELKVRQEQRPKLHKIVQLLCNGEFDRSKVYDAIQSNLNLI